MKKNLLLLLTLSTLVGCSSVSGLLGGGSGTDLSTNYSKYKLVSLSKREANEVLDAIKSTQHRNEIDIEKAESFVGTMSLEEYNDKMTLSVDYNFKKNTYSLSYDVYEYNELVDKQKLEISVEDGYLICKETVLEYYGYSYSEVDKEYARQYSDLESLLMLDSIASAFSVNYYLDEIDFEDMGYNFNASFYGREINKDLTKKEIYAPDFIKIEDGSIMNGDESLTFDCVANKGWMVEFNYEMRSYYDNNYMKASVSCELK